MAEHAESLPKGESEPIRDDIAEKFHDHSSSSSSSDSDDGKPGHPSSVKTRINRLFGREKPVHQILGGGKTADVLLWRNKKISAGVLIVTTVIWILFEVLDYHLLTLVAHGLIFTLAILFLWSNAITLINKSPPRLPEVSIPEDLTLDVALSLRYNINRAFDSLRDITSGRDLKKFLVVIAGLWILSTIGSSIDFLTLVYIVIVLVHTVPPLYEKYDDKIDLYWNKAVAELEKRYTVIHAKVINTTRAAQSKLKKQQ